MMSYHLPSSGSPPNYYPPQHILQPHVTPPQSRQETTQQRKRPKYSRSKTGCLTCRVKKIKCDEAKPSCMRCSHGQRDCTWPLDATPARRKSTSRKDSLELDGRPSTAGSSISEGSTPPTRDHTPPRSHPVELDLPPLASRRTTSEPYFQLHRHPLPTSDSFRRHDSRDRFAYTHPSDSSSSLQMDPLPENATYVPQHRYDHSYTSHTGAARASTGLGMRAGEHISPPTQWHVPPLLSPIMDPYYPPMTVRNMMGHDSPHELHHRYR